MSGPCGVKDVRSLWSWRYHGLELGSDYGVQDNVCIYVYDSLLFSVSRKVSSLILNISSPLGHDSRFHTGAYSCQGKTHGVHYCGKLGQTQDTA